MIDRIGGAASTVGRRTAEDAQWTAAKKEVAARDGKRCRLEKCLSCVEAAQLIQGVCSILDPAHVIPVSEDPTQVYNTRNIVSLRRFIHRRMDAFQNPLTGQPISKNEHYYWWWRILEARIAEYDPATDYKALVLSFILA